MTITNSANKVIVAGSGSQTAFAFSFVGVAAADLSVIYTDASGNETLLGQGPGATQYQVTLNTAQSGSLWGVGGSIAYNPNGSPIALGTTLTIFREIAYTQSVSLQNQSSYGQYAQAAEQAMDLLEMQIQQIAEAQSRVISAPIVDPSNINLVLPPAAQRANTGIAFDSMGNVIAGTTPATGLISSTMQPVVDAASLADARTALGLGIMAELTPNYGLQENVTGEGDVDVNFATVQDAANQSVTAAFHLTQRFATGSFAYALAQSSTLWNGFGFWVTALTAAISFTPNNADNFAGMASGESFTIPVGSSGFVTTNGAGTWWISGLQRVGLNSALNLQIDASVSSDVLTVAIKDSNGNDPSTTSPVLLAFRDPSAVNGGPQIAAVTTALSIAAPDGATFGTANGVPFKLWLVAFNNAGTVVLGLFQSVTNTGSLTAIAGLDESAAQSPAAISAGSTSPATFYAASALTTVAFRILGYIEFGAGQPTAGVWTNSPTKNELFGPGVKKPNDIVNRVYGFTNGTTSNATSTPEPTDLTASIARASPTNLVRTDFSQGVDSGGSGDSAILFLHRGATAIGVGGAVSAGSGSVSCLLGDSFLDVPGTTLDLTYTTYLSSTGGTAVSGGGTLMLEEIMT